MLKKLFIFFTICLFFLKTGDLSAMAKEIVWDKVFKKSELVDVQKVEFQNRFGIKLTGDLYLTKNLKKDE